MKSILQKKSPLLTALAITIAVSLLLPHVAWASEGDAAKFFVSAWLVRIWLGLVSGSAIIIGVKVALDCYSDQPEIEPTLTENAEIVLAKKYKLSYRKMGGGLLCVIVGCALFVTSIFLLPDKRTGYSGLGKIAARFMVDTNSRSDSSHNETSVPSGH